MSFPQKKWGGAGGGRGNFPQTPYIETLLDDRKLRLSAPPVGGRGRRPALFVTVVGGNPRINVYTEVDTDKNGGKIVAKKDALAFFQLLETLQHIIATPEESRWIMVNKLPVEREEGGGGGARREPEIDTKTVVGRDKDGVIYISVLSGDNERPKIIFQFGNQYYHQLARRDAPDVKLENRVISELAARAWVRLMRAATANILVDMAATKGAAKAAKKLAEGGQGGQGGQSGGGNYRKPDNASAKSAVADDFGDSATASTTTSFDFDDDIPM